MTLEVRESAYFQQLYLYFVFAFETTTDEAKKLCTLTFQGWNSFMNLPTVQHKDTKRHKCLPRETIVQVCIS